MPIHQDNFSKLPLNPSQRYQILTVLRDRGYIDKKQFNNPESISVLISKDEKGHDVYDFSKTNGSGLMSLTDVGGGKFSTFNYEGKTNVLKLKLEAGASAQLDKNSLSGKGTIDFVEGKATGSVKGKSDYIDINKEGSIDLKTGETSSGSSLSKDGQAYETPDKPVAPVDKTEVFGSATAGFTKQSDAAAYGVLQPSGSLTEVKVQRDIGFVEGTAELRLTPNAAGALIDKIQKGDVQAATNIAKNGGKWSAEVCAVKGTDTLEHRNAPQIDDETGKASVDVYSASAEACVGMGAAGGFRKDDIKLKVGMLGGKLEHSSTESGDPTDEQRDYIQNHEQDFVGEVGDTASSLGTLGAGTGIPDKIKEAKDWVGKKADELAEKIDETADYVGGKTDEALDWADKKTDELSDRIDDTADYVSDKGSQAIDWVKKKADELSDKLDDTADYVGEKGSQAIDWADRKADEWKEDLSAGYDNLTDKLDSWTGPSVRNSEQSWQGEGGAFGGGGASRSWDNPVDGMDALGGSLGTGGADGKSIAAAEDEADSEAGNADSHADRAEAAARRAQSAARRAQAARARLQAMISRGY